MKILQNIVASIPYACGWVTGSLVRLVAFIRDAVIVGYHDGRRDDYRQDTTTETE